MNVQYEKIFLDKLNLEIKQNIRGKYSSYINNIENSTSINVISEDRNQQMLKRQKIILRTMVMQ